MVKNEAVTQATLEAKEWEGELDNADLIAVSGGNITDEIVNQAKSFGKFWSQYGKEIGQEFTDAFKYNGNNNGDNG